MHRWLTLPTWGLQAPSGLRAVPDVKLQNLAVLQANVHGGIGGAGPGAGPGGRGEGDVEMHTLVRDVAHHHPPRGRGYQRQVAVPAGVAGQSHVAHRRQRPRPPAVHGVELSDAPKTWRVQSQLGQRNHAAVSVPGPRLGHHHRSLIGVHVHRARVAHVPRHDKPEGAGGSLSLRGPGEPSRQATVMALARCCAHLLPQPAQLRLHRSASLLFHLKLLLQRRHLRLVFSRQLGHIQNSDVLEPGQPVARRALGLPRLLDPSADAGAPEEMPALQRHHAV
mmetsp:Transcript_824/g.1739  ORF Transcript_824/g.1739 Transcript_824/m.1739 type:complete len:279 (+) Transcript_824:2-838(+)